METCKCTFIIKCGSDFCHSRGSKRFYFIRWCHSSHPAASHRNHTQSAELWNKPHIDFHNPTVPFASHGAIPSIRAPLLAARLPGVADASLATCQENAEQLSVPSCSRTWEVSLCCGHKEVVFAKKPVTTSPSFSSSSLSHHLSPASQNLFF